MRFNIPLTLAAIVASLTAALPANASAPEAQGAVERVVSSLKLSAASTYADAGARIDVKVVAPKGTKKLTVERRVSGRWVSSATEVGHVKRDSVSGRRLVARGYAVAVFGNSKYRVTGTIDGQRLASKPVRLSGYKWVPLRDVVDGYDEGNVDALGKSLPSFWEDASSGEHEWTTEGVSCREVEVGIRVSDEADPVVTGGMKILTDAGAIHTVPTVAGPGASTRVLFSLDGSPFTVLTTAYRSNYVSRVSFAGNGFCNGYNR